MFLAWVPLVNRLVRKFSDSCWMGRQGDQWRVQNGQTTDSNSQPATTTPGIRHYPMPDHSFTSVSSLDLVPVGAEARFILFGW